MEYGWWKAILSPPTPISVPNPDAEAFNPKNEMTSFKVTTVIFQSTGGFSESWNAGLVS